MEGDGQVDAARELLGRDKADEIDMTKKIAGIFLILIATGVWLYLDLLNKQELGSAEQIQQSVESARAEAKTRDPAGGPLQRALGAGRHHFIDDDIRPNRRGH